jgi:hypothetical protein
MSGGNWDLDTGSRRYSSFAGLWTCLIWLFEAVQSMITKICEIRRYRISSQGFRVQHLVRRTVGDVPRRNTYSVTPIYGICAEIPSTEASSGAVPRILYSVVRLTPKISAARCLFPPTLFNTFWA